METEFDIMFKQILLSLNGVIDLNYIKLGKRVGNKYQDVCIHIPYKNINESRPICCIEVKKTTTSGLSECFEQGIFSKKLEYSVRQSLGYAEANHYIRHNIKIQPFCILTDGKYIAFLDPRKSWIDNVENLMRYKEQHIALFSKKNFADLFKKFKSATVESILDANLTFDLKHPSVREAFKDANTCDSRLASNLLGTHIIFKKLGLSEEKSIDYTMQCFLLAVLRNCGFIKVEEIEKNISLERNNDWLLKLLELWFGKNFDKVESKYLDSFKEAYSTTKTYDVRVDAMPQEALGYAYEAFIKSAKKSKATEFYTPDLLIGDVLDRLVPNINDIIFDPTCGCGSFLIEAVKRIFNNSVSTKAEIDKLSSFLSNNVFGNDRDVYAVCIAKASLLSLFVERLGVDPTMTKLSLPVVKNNFTKKDYFEFLWDKKKQPTLVIGNAPWGDVSSDSESFNELVGDKKKWKLIQEVRDLNDDRHEISGSVVLKCIDDFSSNKDFRMGILVKQQLLVKDKDKFLTDERAKNCFYYDYGDRKLFSHTNSLTAVAFYERGAKNKVYPKFNKLNINFGKMVDVKSLNATFYQGVQTGKNQIWKDLARVKKLSKLHVSCIDRTHHKIPIQKPILEKLVYLEPKSKIFNKKNKSKEELNYIKNFKRKYILLERSLTPEQMQVLGSMTTGSKKVDRKTGKIIKEDKSKSEFIYTWRRPIDAKFLSNNWKIIFPNQLTGIEKQCRLPVFLTKDKIIAKTSYTEIIFDEIENESVYCLLGWMSSKIFMIYLEMMAADLKIKRLSGGYELLPEYAEKISIPEVILNSKKLAMSVSKILKKKIVSEVDLNKIDLIIIQELKISGINRTLVARNKLKQKIKNNIKNKTKQSA